MSDAARRHAGRGTSLLARPLSDADLAATPVLASLDALAVEELTAEETDRFLAALEE